MEPRYCWRCNKVVPMLDEAEFVRVRKLYDAGVEATKELEKKIRGPAIFPLIDDAFAPVTKEYEEITGWSGMHYGAVMHHRIVMDDFEKQLSGEQKKA